MRCLSRSLLSRRRRFRSRAVTPMRRFLPRLSLSSSSARNRCRFTSDWPRFKLDNDWLRLGKDRLGDAKDWLGLDREGLSKDWLGLGRDWVGLDNDWLGLRNDWLEHENGWLGLNNDWQCPDKDLFGFSLGDMIEGDRFPLPFTRLRRWLFELLEQLLLVLKPLTPGCCLVPLSWLNDLMSMILEEMLWAMSGVDPPKLLPQLSLWLSEPLESPIQRKKIGIFLVEFPHEHRGTSTSVSFVFNDIYSLFKLVAWKLMWYYRFLGKFLVEFPHADGGSEIGWRYSCRPPISLPPRAWGNSTRNLPKF